MTGAIGQVELGPLFRQPYACVEHPFGQLDYAGDALGTDCHIEGGVIGGSGFIKAFRTDGRTNEDWYGWHAEVLVPLDGMVMGVLEKPEENVSGTMPHPAAMLQLRDCTGVVVVFAHVTGIRVKRGGVVKRGQVVVLVGNNGFARAPHMHVSAYRETDANPLQVRWDLWAMATAQDAGAPGSVAPR